ncbi:MAG: hypothetical protein R3267_09170, partial [Paenisporosarcina sp.]|nr:hypothetical protein [Paenisporosarcina sp.]
MINEEGDTVVCIRVDSEVQFSTKFPSWIHYLVEKRKRAPKDEVNTAYIEGNPKAAPTQLHAVYTQLLNCTRLSDTHYQHLASASRGLSEREILARQYSSLPEKPWLTANAMAKVMDATQFAGVPGFYQTQYGWSIASKDGMLIPYRNEFNQIIGFQTRADVVPNDVKVDPGSIEGLQARVIEQPNLVQIMIDGEIIEEVELTKNEGKMVFQGSNYGFVELVDGQKYYWLSSANKENGTGAGNPLPIHVAIPSEQLRTWKTGELHQAHAVWITEGALKADIAAEHIPKVYDPEELVAVGSTVLAVP